MTTVLVAGACGFIGRSAVAATRRKRTVTNPKYIDEVRKTAAECQIDAQLVPI
jgi:nucleoside-diphosphate-sugar epimerase